MSNLRKPMDIDRLNSDFKMPKSSWIVTYADIMTIILTFFILLLSISTIAQTKYEMIVQAFTGEKAGNLMEVQEDIEEVIEERGLSGEVKTLLDLEGLKVSFSNALLFPSASADLRVSATEALNPIVAHLAEQLADRYGVIIEGYTDDVPISNSLFHSNWELSTSRAISVMNVLTEAGFDRRRASVQGFADTRSATEIDLTLAREREALSPDELERARSASRRVVLRIDTLSPELINRIQERGGWTRSSTSAEPTRPAEPSAPELNPSPTIPNKSPTLFIPVSPQDGVTP